MAAPPSFEFIRGNERLDWGILVSIDAERLVANPNVETLQRIVGNLGFSRIHREEVAMFNADHVVHLLRLYQLIVQYVIYSQDCLAKVNNGIAKRNTELRQQVKELESSLAAAQAEITQLQKALAAANAYSLSQKVNGAEKEALERAGPPKANAKTEESGASPTSVHVCPFCHEQYHRIESLQSHLRKRHAISSTPAQPLPASPSSPHPYVEGPSDPALRTQPTKHHNVATHPHSSNSEEVKVLTRRIEELEKQLEQEHRMTTDNLLRDQHYLMMLLLQCFRGGRDGSPGYLSDLPPHCQKLLSSLSERSNTSETGMEGRPPLASGPSSFTPPVVSSQPAPILSPPSTSLPSAAPPPLPPAAEPTTVPLQAAPSPPVLQSSQPSGSIPELPSSPSPSTVLAPSPSAGVANTLGGGNTDQWSRLPFTTSAMASTPPPPPSTLSTVPVVPDVAALSSATNGAFQYRQEMYEKELQELRGQLASLRHEWQEKQQSSPWAVLPTIPSTTSTMERQTTPPPPPAAYPVPAVASSPYPSQTSEQGKPVDNLLKYGPPGAAFIPPKRATSPQRVPSPSRPLWLSPPPPPSVYPVRVPTAALAPERVVSHPREPSAPNTVPTTSASSTPPSASPHQSGARSPSTAPILTNYERVQGEHGNSSNGKPHSSVYSSIVPSSAPAPSPALSGSTPSSAATPPVPPPTVTPVQAPPETPVPPTVTPVQAPSVAPVPPTVTPVQPPPATPVTPAVVSPSSFAVSGSGPSGAVPVDGQRTNNPAAQPIVTPKTLLPVEVPKPLTSSPPATAPAVNVVKKFNPAVSDSSSSYTYSYSEGE